MKYVDLHSHTTASDGQYSPAEVYDRALELGIIHYAITDHDTIDGIPLLVKEARLDRHSIFIPGIEISTQDICEIHIVGLGIDYNNQALQDACLGFKRDRDERGLRICDYLCRNGIKIQYDDVKSISRESNLGRPHFAEFLLRNGYVRDKREAFHRYLDTEEFHKCVDRILPDLSTSVNLIHNSGGVAVLAHPGIYGINREEIKDLIGRCADAGIDAVECYYSKHSSDETKEYIEISKKYRLMISVGSDFHGENVKPDVYLGMLKPPYDEYVHALIDVLENNKIVRDINDLGLEEV